MKINEYYENMMDYDVGEYISDDITFLTVKY